MQVALQAAEASWKNCTGVLALQKDFHISNCKSNQIKSKLHFYSTFHTGLPRHFTPKAKPLKCLWRQQVRRALSQGIGAGRQQHQEMALAERSLHHRARLSTPTGRGKPQGTDPYIRCGAETAQELPSCSTNTNRERKSNLCLFCSYPKGPAKAIHASSVFYPESRTGARKGCPNIPPVYTAQWLQPELLGSSRFWGTVFPGCPPLQPTQEQEQTAQPYPAIAADSKLTCPLSHTQTSSHPLDQAGWKYSTTQTAKPSGAIKQHSLHQG